MQILIYVIIIVWIIAKAKAKSDEASAGKTGRASGGPELLKNLSKKTQSSAVPNVPKKKQASAVPNVPKKKQSSAVPNILKKSAPAKEAAMEAQTCISAKVCNYEAAYSKGKPSRIGGRGDYEDFTPQGMSRVRCAYCGAENFVPAGTREHYHCYFCWEKL